jgi:hypothetical protein
VSPFERPSSGGCPPHTTLLHISAPVGSSLAARRSHRPSSSYSPVRSRSRSRERADTPAAKLPQGPLPVRRVLCRVDTGATCSNV